MLTLSIPGRGDYQIEHLVLDVNGTLAQDGVLLDGVKDRLNHLRRDLAVDLLTADTHGRQATIDAELHLSALRLERGRPEAEQKAAVVRRLGAAGTIAIGNGANDEAMLAAAAIGIAVLGPEGTATATLLNADVVARTITEALDLVLHPQRLVATLRR